MKVFIAVLLAISAVAGKGSGPYLPSGWRPEGPAFYLPSEEQKPSDHPLKETLLQESEASNSEALREYGPPKLDESPLQITNQGLPDVITEQTFFETKSEQLLVESEVDVEEKTEQIITISETINTVTESQEAALEQITGISEIATLEAKTLDIDSTERNLVGAIDETITENKSNVPIEDSVTERQEDSVEQSSELLQSELATTVSSAEENLKTDAEITTVAVEEKVVDNGVEVETVEVVVPSLVIAEEAILGENLRENQELSTTVVEESTQSADVEPTAVVIEEIVAIEKELPAPIEDDATESVGEGRSSVGALNDFAKDVVGAEILSSLEHLPEGFLEYGPPGFKEYGPPKEGDLKTGAIQLLPGTVLENNEVRKRRFSPKFRASKKAH